MRKVRSRAIVNETSADLLDLQALLDRSYASAGGHLRAIFTEASRLSATEVAESVTGIFEMHLATTTADGAPFVAPIDGLFFKGRIWFGCPAPAIRTKHLRRDARVSASYTRDQSFAFVVHGVAREVTKSDPAFEPYSVHMQALYLHAYGPDWTKWYERKQRTAGDGFIAWIEPRRMFVKR